MWFDLGVAALEDLSREELIALAREQDARIAELTDRLARLEHLLSRNSKNSSMPPSRDDDVGRTPPTPRAGGAPKRSRGKQPGAPGSNLAWREVPDEHRDQFPHGRCECGADVAAGRDLGVVDRYQQHEIPLIAVKVTQYDQHAVACRCGLVHTADRPEGARSGPVGYGPNLQAWCVYLIVVHFVPVQRCRKLVESLTGTAPSAGFIHGMLTRAAGLLEAADKRIRALLTAAYVVCADETPLRIGPATPPAGRKKAMRYLLVACTTLFTHYLAAAGTWTPSPRWSSRI